MNEAQPPKSAETVAIAVTEIRAGKVILAVMINAANSSTPAYVSAAFTKALVETHIKPNHACEADSIFAQFSSIFLQKLDK